MKIYWSLNQIPELSELTPSERRHVHRLCLRRYGINGRGTYRASIACGLCGMIGAAIGIVLQRAFDSPSPIVYMAICGGIGGMIGGCILTQVLLSQLRPHYSEFIREARETNQNDPVDDRRQ